VCFRSFFGAILLRLHLVPNFGMSGAVPHFSLYTFMAFTCTTLAVCMSNNGVNLIINLEGCARLSLVAHFSELPRHLPGGHGEANENCKPLSYVTPL
jgi:hypothetical protein